MKRMGLQWNWKERKAEKEQHREIAKIPLFSNAHLKEKAVRVAEELLRLGFVSQVGIIGSTARGEEGNDVDIVAIDDGTISLSVLDTLNKGSGMFGEVGVGLFFDFSGGSYTNLCYRLLAEHLPGRFDSLFYQYILKKPMAIDLIFLNPVIKWNQEYLDELAMNMRDPFFFQNIGEDVLVFHPMTRGFKKGFCGFINNGVPSDAAMFRIEEEEKLFLEKRGRMQRRLRAGYGGEKILPDSRLWHY